MTKKFFSYALLALALALGFSANAQDRWSKERINDWYAKQPWMAGANYVPASAINQLEMWQEASFDPERIDRELGWAEDLGFNTMRVFLHHMLWEQDQKGFIKRINKYLKIADKHGIRTMFVLLDDVWHPYPNLGKQPAPLKGVHNSGWVQSPGRNILERPDRWDELEGYVKGILKHYANDKRVVFWDLYNEPGNTNGNSYGGGGKKIELPNKRKYSLGLLKKVYKWAREVNPSQPLSIDVWTSVGKKIEQMSAIDRFAYENSDVINFHCYSSAATTEKTIKELSKSGRPLVCTEYMARPHGDGTFQNVMPVLKKYNVVAYNWGFVAGKSQTNYPWSSWQKPFENEPKLWFHDIFRENGEPYKQAEVDFIKRTTGKQTL
ncbi:hypothetical protein FUAX_33340 [Fulvitalea axinellae]|uniref:Glycoside hydrolase family 5 domain-containing protein n=1 Tax=Fulvitalea axinellae TaxID=1182444 RepID=A0AAU9CSB0_9BACT|nr:hypothetical protein FUAX_33340 [Fulvitalea axinellae]